MPARKLRDTPRRTLYFRPKDELACYIYALAVATSQPIREIMERMIVYCRDSKDFHVPAKERPAYVSKAAEAKRRRISHYKKLARIK